MVRIPRSLVAWFVAFGLLLNGLMPLVAHATTKTGFAPMAICSASTGKSETLETPAASHLHCTYCCTGTDDSPLPSKPAHSPAYLELTFESPQVAPPSPRIAAIHGLAQPRAPPIHA